MRTGKRLALQVCRIYGSQAAVARRLGCSVSSVHRWLNGGSMSAGWRRALEAEVAADRANGGTEQRKKQPRRRAF